MLYLIGSIILSSWLILSFKLVERFGINTFQAIVFNYITCVITGSIVNGDTPFKESLIHENWFPWAMLMGSMFISLFNLIGYTAQRSGISVASVAYKLSLVIPFVLSIFLYQEKVTFLRILGLVLCIPAIYLVNRRKQNSKAGFGLALLPIILFIGSGLLDSLIKYTEQRFLDGNNNDEFLITAFGAAAAIGFITLLWQLIAGKTYLSWKAVLAGIAIGIPNYFSIWCLVNVLKKFEGNSSAIIPVNNMAIVAFSTVVAALLFKEKLSRSNWLGIIVSLGAIALIAFG